MSGSIWLLRGRWLFVLLIASVVQSRMAGQPVGDLQQLASFRASEHADPRIRDLVFSADGKQLATFDVSFHAKIWDIKDRKMLQGFEFKQPSYRWVCGDFMPTGELLVVGQLNPLQKGWEAWKCNVKTGAREHIQDGAWDGAWTVWPDKNMVVVTEDAHVYDAPGPLKFVDLSGKNKAIAVKCDNYYRVLTYSTDKALVVLQVGKPVGGRDHHTRIVEIATGKVVARLPWVEKCRLSGDKKTLLVVDPDGWGDNVLLWDVASGKELYRGKLRLIVEFLSELSSDGRTMAVVSAGIVTFFDFQTRQLGMTYLGSRVSKFASLRFAPDGKSFAVGEESGIVRIFETPRLEAPKARDKKQK